MKLGLYTHPACLDHQPGAGHPECPERLAAVLDALRQAWPETAWTDAPRASREVIERAHKPALISGVIDRDTSMGYRIDADTFMSPGSAEAALRAAGAACAAIDAIAAGALNRAFCAVRPPGHHATRAQAMGFCLFNSLAIAALHARERHAGKRVALIDFDVHHGNGSQDILWDEPGMMYVSSHQSPLYPGTGLPYEQGGRGRIRNGLLAEGAGSAEFRRLWTSELLPELEAFRPDWLLISAGFDAHRLDPLAGLNLTADDYGWLTTQLVGVANRHANGRIVSALEGGYSLTALRECAVAHVRALMEDV